MKNYGCGKGARKVYTDILIEDIDHFPIFKRSCPTLIHPNLRAAINNTSKTHPLCFDTSFSKETPSYDFYIRSLTALFTKVSKITSIAKQFRTFILPRSFPFSKKTRLIINKLYRPCKNIWK